MKKLIIVEGPDYSGKTTYIKKLVEQFENTGQKYYVLKLPYFFGKSDLYTNFLDKKEEKNVKKWIKEIKEENKREDWWLIMLYLHKKAKDYIEEMFSNCDDMIIIQDRNYLSTFVYQSYYFKSFLNYKIFKELIDPQIDRASKEMKILLPPFSVLKERMNKERETSKEFENFESKLTFYYRTYKELLPHLPQIFGDYLIEVIK